MRRCTDGTAEAFGRLSSARLAAIELPKGSGYDYAHRNGVIGHPDDRLESFGSDRSLPSNRAHLASSNSNPISSVCVRVEPARAVGG